MKALYNSEFIFADRYHVHRHLLYWSAHTVLWSAFWSLMFYLNVGDPYIIPSLVKMLLWLPIFLFFALPITHIMIPRLLLKEKYLVFFAVLLAWALAGVYFHGLYRRHVFIPVQLYLKFDHVHTVIHEAASYLCMSTTAAEAGIIVVFKHWSKKQHDWLRAEKEKVTAELELLKAQLHPHFLFNTLNNIYSFALQNSNKTPALILKLSSLLSYMLYDCNKEEVDLVKELEIMKNYIDLEKERYGDQIDISVNIEGAVHDREIAPLLLLPFLENAFKHGTSEQLTRRWLSFDLAVTGDTLWCKIVNSKNEIIPMHKNGIGIENVRKRLQFLYPEKHHLKISDEGNFFSVSLELKLPSMAAYIPSTFNVQTDNKTVA